MTDAEMHSKKWLADLHITTPETVRWLSQKCQGYQQQPGGPLTAVIEGRVLLDNGSIVHAWKLSRWPGADDDPGYESDILYEQPHIDIPT